jgi:hypothetical protein
MSMDSYAIALSKAVNMLRPEELAAVLQMERGVTATPSERSIAQQRTTLLSTLLKFIAVFRCVCCVRTPEGLETIATLYKTWNSRSDTQSECVFVLRREPLEHLRSLLSREVPKCELPQENELRRVCDMITGATMLLGVLFRAKMVRMAMFLMRTASQYARFDFLGSWGGMDAMDHIGAVPKIIGPPAITGELPPHLALDTFTLLMLVARCACADSTSKPSDSCTRPVQRSIMMVPNRGGKAQLAWDVCDIGLICAGPRGSLLGLAVNQDVTTLVCWPDASASCKTGAPCFRNGRRATQVSPVALPLPCPADGHQANWLAFDDDSGLLAWGVKEPFGQVLESAAEDTPPLTWVRYAQFNQISGAFDTVPEDDGTLFSTAFAAPNRVSAFSDAMKVSSCVFTAADGPLLHTPMAVAVHGSALAFEVVTSWPAVRYRAAGNNVQGVPLELDGVILSAAWVRSRRHA